jgi:hypothetical protein
MKEITIVEHVDRIRRARNVYEIVVRKTFG